MEEGKGSQGGCFDYTACALLLCYAPSTCWRIMSLLEVVFFFSCLLEFLNIDMHGKFEVLLLVFDNFFIKYTDIYLHILDMLILGH